MVCALRTSQFSELGLFLESSKRNDGLKAFRKGGVRHMNYRDTVKTGTNRKPRYPSTLPIPAPLMAALYRQAADMGVSVNNLAIIAIERGLP
jgi:hypothetical protein